MTYTDMMEEIVRLRVALYHADESGRQGHLCPELANMAPGAWPKEEVSPGVWVDVDPESIVRAALVATVQARVDEAPVAWRGKHVHPGATAWVYVDGPNRPATAFGGLGQLEPLFAAAPAHI